MSPLSGTPRRVLRTKLRCVARVATRLAGHWLTYTRDFSALGCQVDAPSPVEPGTAISLELLDDRAGPGFAVAGSVAWCGNDAPFVVGVAFDDASVRLAAEFFERVSAARPELAALTPAPKGEAAEQWVAVLAHLP